jgi:cutinase
MRAHPGRGAATHSIRHSVRRVVLALAIALGLGATAAGTAQASCNDFMFIGARGSGQTADAQTLGMGQEVFDLYSFMITTTYLHNKTLDSLPVIYDAASTDTLMPSKGQFGLIALGQFAPAALSYYQNNLSVFLGSINEGTATVITEANDTLAACPKSKLILAGYSQGAMAVHQAEGQLAATGQTNVLAHIAGTLLVADGDQAPNSRAHRIGSAPSMAQGVRAYLTGLVLHQKPDDVLLPASTANICNAGDLVCDFNLGRLRHASAAAKVHTTYPADNELLLAQAVQWLGDRIFPLPYNGCDTPLKDQSILLVRRGLHLPDCFFAAGAAARRPGVELMRVGHGEVRYPRNAPLS